MTIPYHPRLLVLTLTTILWFGCFQGLQALNHSQSPSFSPSLLPTTLSPSGTPSTESPTVSPTLIPTISSAPSNSPRPSQRPSGLPSDTPTTSLQPSHLPSTQPSVTPSQSVAPSTLPSHAPSIQPTDSAEPSLVPSRIPSVVPSQAPSTFPSWSPTPEPNCTSFTDGPVYFQRFLALRFEAEIDLTTWIQDNIPLAYEEVVQCHLKGSFRSIETVEVVSLHEAGSSVHHPEYVVQMEGWCEGCDPSALALFNETATTQQLPSRRALHEWEDVAEGMLLRRDSFFRVGYGAMTQRSSMAQTCACPAPSESNFESVLNELLRVEYSSDVSLQGIMELEESTDCWNEASVESFSTYVTVRLSLSDSSLSPEELSDLALAFETTYQQQSSFVEGTCDQWDRQLQVVDVQMQGLHRRLSLRSRRPDTTLSRKLGIDNALLPYSEVLFTINASCVGCNGRLFGNSALQLVDDTIPINDTDRFLAQEFSERQLSVISDCLCPVEITSRGVSKSALPEDLNDTLKTGGFDSLSVVQDVFDVFVVEPVDCPSQTGTFESMIVVEYEMRPNVTGEPTLDEIALLEEAFVAAYNLIAIQFCDPYRRRLTRATAVKSSGVVFGEPYAIQFETFGTCRGCDNNITLYDSVSFLTNISVSSDENDRRSRALGGIPIFMESLPLETRRLEDGGEVTTCYCDVNAVPDQGPSEVEAVVAYGDIVKTLSLPHILTVADCKYITIFQSSVILNFKGDPKNATVEQLEALGQGFIDTYNRINSGDVVCDRQFRHLTDFLVDANITLNDEFLEAGGLDGNQSSSVDGRRTLSRTQIQRRIEEVGISPSPSEAPTTIFGVTTNAPTEAPTGFNHSSPPSMAPTLHGVEVEDSVNVLLYVSGTCRGCESNFGLFDQISGRRRRLEDSGGQIDLDFVTATGSCFCPPDAIEATPSEDVIVEAFVETVEVLKEEGTLLFVEEVEDLEEVTVVQCVVETNEFETVVVADFFAYFDEINRDDLEDIRVTFNTTYNRLSQDFCDHLFRRSLAVGSIEYEQISATDDQGISRVRFYMSVLGRCRDCVDGDSLMVDDERELRRLKEEDLCFCDSGTRGERPPTEDEMEEVYRDSWADHRSTDRRRLAGGGVETFISFGIPLPSAQPSMAPSPGPTSPPTLSIMPSARPSVSPTTFGTSQSPTLSLSPTAKPTPVASSIPTSAPSVSESPTSAPTSSNIPTGVVSSPPSQSMQPTLSVQPTRAESFKPSSWPSSFPSSFPSSLPSTLPTTSPTSGPTEVPTTDPSATPTGLPSSDPSLSPSSFPSQFPSSLPTGNPSGDPTGLPTQFPTGLPTMSPSDQPTSEPSVPPTMTPSTPPSGVPTTVPSVPPTAEPSEVPSRYPTGMPSAGPTKSPSSMPSENPTRVPSSGPTASPSSMPSEFPTDVPSEIPTKNPTTMPSEIPTKMPSEIPTKSPTSVPSEFPTKVPSEVPTKSPTAIPSEFPTKKPSEVPTKGPTAVPSEFPTKMPSDVPTRSPTAMPSEFPTKAPTTMPSEFPTKVPSEFPTKAPTTMPSEFPTKVPSDMPTKDPTTVPSAAPSQTCFTGDAASVTSQCNGRCCSGTDACSGWSRDHVVCIESCVGTEACAGWTGGDMNTVGYDSCNGGDFACKNWGGGTHTIGDGSCQGTSACEEWAGGGTRLVNNDACLGTTACYDWGGGDKTIRGYACDGEDACSAWGTGDSTVGANSCVGFKACHDWTEIGTRKINEFDGTASCVGDFACALWRKGDKTVGSGSCLQLEACFIWGHFATETTTVIVGDSSCTIQGSCHDWVGDGTIKIAEGGSGSCTALDSCTLWGLGDKTIGTASCTNTQSCAEWGVGEPSNSVAILGNGACNRAQSCYQWGGGGTINIGNNACAGGATECIYWQGGDHTVGATSCASGTNVCQGHPGGTEIGAGSCRVTNSCNEVGRHGPASSVTIGGGSCLSNGACIQMGNYVTGAIVVGESSCRGGNDSCNKYGEGSGVRAGASIDIGDNACKGLDSVCRVAGRNAKFDWLVVPTAQCNGISCGGSCGGGGDCTVNMTVLPGCPDPCLPYP